MKTRTSYSEYLVSDHWRKKTLAMRRKYPTCYCCGLPAECTHHRHYKTRGRERDEDLITLCHACHEVLEANIGGKWTRKQGHKKVRALKGYEPPKKPINGIAAHHPNFTEMAKGQIRRYLDKLRTRNGGYTKLTVTSLGCKWPAKRGWYKKIIDLGK